MQLFSRWQNSAGERVRIALNLKGIDYEYVPVGSLPRGEYKRLNPQGLMPAMRIGDRVIAQSAAILEYLEETRPDSPLLPSDAVQRAEARSFAQLITSDLHPINNNRIRKYLADELDASEAAVLGWYRHWMEWGLSALETTLKNRREETPFCYGTTPGWAELHLIPQLANARRFDFDVGPFTRLLEIEARCVSLPAFQKARPEAQPDYPQQ